MALYAEWVRAHGKGFLQVSGELSSVWQQCRCKHFSRKKTCCCDYFYNSDNMCIDSVSSEILSPSCVSVKITVLFKICQIQVQHEQPSFTHNGRPMQTHHRTSINATSITHYSRSAARHCKLSWRWGISCTSSFNVWTCIICLQGSLLRMKPMKWTSEKFHLMSSPRSACISPTRSVTPTAPQKYPNSPSRRRSHWNCSWLQTFWIAKVTKIMERLKRSFFFVFLNI